MENVSEWEPELQFLKNQVQGEGSLLQSAFDLLFGAIVPIGCFYFDPIVFTSDDSSGLFSGYSTFVNILAAVAICGLIVWKLLGKRIKLIASFIAILFYFSAIASLFLGLALLPYSVMGILLAFMGLLGFTPFISAFVYYRNGLRAMRFGGQV